MKTICITLFVCCFVLKISGNLFFNVPWKNQQVTYTIQNFSPYLSETETREAIRRAFDIWSAVIPRDFIEVASYDTSADIKIRFESLNHEFGDDAFDGPDGVIAHADIGGGKLHFDSDERWKKYKNFEIVTIEDKDIMWTAIHEIGHVLGLNHSPDENSVMYYSFKPEAIADSNGRYIEPKLLQSDIHSIQAIYGSRTQNMPQMPQSPQIPYFHQIPQMPQFPQFPQIQQFPQMPLMPQFPQMPRFSQYQEFPQIQQFPQMLLNHQFPIFQFANQQRLF